MVERWKVDAVRALERLAYGVEQLAEEFERHNDRKYQKRREEKGLDAINQKERERRKENRDPQWERGEGHEWR